LLLAPGAAVAPFELAKYAIPPTSAAAPTTAVAMPVPDFQNEALMIDGFSMAYPLGWSLRETWSTPTSTSFPRMRNRWELVKAR
jgi:hypothetical protein